MKSAWKGLAAGFLLCLALPPLTAVAGFRISPMRIDLEGASGSGSITITNDDEKPLTFQVSAVAWTQDASGKDVYAETGDLIVFPKITSVEKGGSQVIRVGVKSPAGPREKSYRLFVQGVSPPSESAGGGKVAIQLRMGIPVFLKPVKGAVLGEVSEAAVSGGVFRVLVRNTGSAHFRIEKLKVRGTDGSGREVFAREIDGWYLLHGASRRYEIPVPREICRQAAKFSVAVKADLLEFDGAAAVEAENCVD